MFFKSLLLAMALLAATGFGQCINGQTLSSIPEYIMSTTTSSTLAGSLFQAPFCNCYSGFTSEATSCATNSTGSCSLPTANPLQTASVAEFTSGASLSTQANVGIVAFQVYSPATSNRYFEAVTFTGIGSMDSSTPADPACAYPTSPYLLRSFNSSVCSDVIDSTLPYGLVTGTCLGPSSLDTTSTPGMSIYSGMLTIFVGETVASSTNAFLIATRMVQSSLLLEFHLPNTFDLAFSLAVQSPVAMDALLISQKYDRSTGVVTLVVLTQIAQPYKLDPATPPSINTTSSSSFTNMTTVAPVNVTCPGNPTAAPGFNDVPYCQQTTFFVGTIGLDPANGPCTLNGDFALTWNYVCNPLFLDCVSTPPVGSALASVQAYATLSLSSNNLCSKLSVVASLNAALTSSGSSDGTSFTTGQTSNFSIAIISSSIPVQSVVITSVTINYTDVNGAAQSFSLYGPSSTPTAASIGSEIGWGIASNGGNSDSPSFVFNPSSSLFGYEPGPQFGTPAVIPFTVQVTASVTYSTSFSAPGSRKRGAQLESKTFTKQAYFISKPKQTALHSLAKVEMSSANSFSGFLFGFSAFAFLLFSRRFFLYRKKLF